MQKSRGKERNLKRKGESNWRISK